MDAGIMIGCPVRNRAWVLPRYLEHLLHLDYPRHLMQYCFIINDCTDHTAEILEEFAARPGIRAQLIYAGKSSPSPLLSFPSPAGHSGPEHRGRYSLPRLADLRNTLLQAFLASDCQYLFSVDSDILVPHRILRDLLADDCQVVSALVCNGHQLGYSGIYNVLRRVGDYYEFIREFPRDSLFPVDCTGAAYLIRRDVIEDYGVIYSAEKGGEDIGFCERAAMRGIPLYCDGRLECRHIMKEDLLNIKSK
ncbi:MAG: glycosyltransferase [Deltaproteobacteria bacterium]